jgi:hypothetical protein
MSYVDVDSDAALGILPGTTGQVDPASVWPIAGDAGSASGTGAGRYGVSLDTGGTMFGNVFLRVWNWLNTPFTTPFSAVDMFLIGGVIFGTIILWNMILYHVRIAGEAI